MWGWAGGRANTTVGPSFIYTSPFITAYTEERTDMGVDFCLPAGAPIRAIDSGTILGINPDWFDGEPYVWYRMEHPLDSQHSVIYVAEQIALEVTVGEHVAAGETLGTFAASGTCIETGWGDSARLGLDSRSGHHRLRRGPGHRGRNELSQLPRHAGSRRLHRLLVGCLAVVFAAVLAGGCRR